MFWMQARQLPGFFSDLEVMWRSQEEGDIPSGNLMGKSPFFMGKYTINSAHSPDFHKAALEAKVFKVKR